MKRLFNVTFSLQKLWVLMFAASAFVIAGCSSGGDDVTPIPDEPEKPKPQDKTQVIVDVSTLEVPEGKTVDLRFKIVPSTVDISSADGGCRTLYRYAEFYDNRGVSHNGLCDGYLYREQDLSIKPLCASQYAYGERDFEYRVYAREESLFGG